MRMHLQFSTLRTTTVVYDIISISNIKISIYNSHHKTSTEARSRAVNDERCLDMVGSNISALHPHLDQFFTIPNYLFPHVPFTPYASTCPILLSCILFCSIDSVATSVVFNLPLPFYIT